MPPIDQWIPPDVWGKRSAALSEEIEIAVRRLRVTELPEAMVLAGILRALDGFHKRLFGHFYTGFYDPETPPLARSALFPPDYVLETLLSHAGFDLSAILQIHDGRLLAGVDPDLARPARDALGRGDLLAGAALYPARTAGIVDGNVDALTYREKAARIRVIPYTPAALIRIPYTAQKAERDHLATPHEVGHYVYRHGSLNGLEPCYMQLQREFAGEPVWAQRWIEEMFADVWGGLVGGPAVALSFQDLQLAETGAAFVSDDSAHPTPLLRPHIYAKVIESGGVRWSEAAHLLRVRWAAMLATRAIANAGGADGDLAQGPKSRDDAQGNGGETSGPKSRDDAQGGETEGPKSRDDAQGDSGETQGPSSFAAQDETSGPKSRDDAQGSAHPSRGPKSRDDAQSDSALTFGPSSFAAMGADTFLADGAFLPVDTAISTEPGFDLALPLDRMVARMLELVGPLDVPAVWSGYYVTPPARVRELALTETPTLEAIRAAADDVYAAFERGVLGIDPNEPHEFPIPPAQTRPRISSFEGLMEIALADYTGGLEGEPEWVSLFLAGGWTQGPKSRDDAQRMQELAHGPKSRDDAQGDGETTKGPKSRDDAQGDDRDRSIPATLAERPQATRSESAQVFGYPARVRLLDGKRTPELLQLVERGHAYDPGFFREREPFFFAAEISNDQVDAYFTRMMPSTLGNFARDAGAGVAFRKNHIQTELPLGRSISGRVESYQGRNRVVSDVYIVPGLKLSDVPNDDVIAAIRSGTLADVSVGFYLGEGGRITCDLCGRDLMDWECPHIPGMGYEHENQKRTATFGVHNARLSEFSGVYDGAAPNAAILKAERMAGAGQLKPEAARLVEAKYRIKLPESRHAWPGNTPEKGSNMEPQKQLETIRSALKTAGYGEDMTAGLERVLADAADGRQYRADLLEDALAEGVRALGDKFNRATYEGALRTSPLATIRQMRDDWQRTGDARLPGGRLTRDGEQTGKPKVALVPDAAYRT